MRPLFLALALCAGLAACGSPKQTADNLPAAGAYMAQNAKQRGVVVLPSGLQYKVERSGPAAGPHPRLSDEVKVHYEGKLVTGEVFDSSYQRGTPAAFPLEGLIPGWVEALQLMRPGDQWTLYVPPALGYGDQGGGPIPPNSVLIFKIELIDVFQHPAAPGA
ncbi:MAG: FKBP-type peptidyl-prolyl cis-trans isomerase [Clostridia bacterium]|uniref:FKBP-type peptidyl-prolyl cis-trans isomerase n=1 Tax=Caulobacter sp. CCUG 60055 TaxID=2100090 RepID=UPI001FA79035|nr:FKBP-type peptidyl-prolyl cis-trans isomerase [Caulobacter sp. CCUG 60055]MBQ1543665.1 FKBP-type peptidyl-prolyl cis-trans isomerase [Caulobacteraceae bacterium]MBQ8109230.1 FKBP-type peptidyl-prolyl cis-trans isomerase [Clostridia bacterium]MCI3181562.1 peptidylprolyl isomerase [Caulobacter sp. CCUG 60055]